MWQWLLSNISTEGYQIDDLEKDSRDTQILSGRILDMPIPDNVKAFVQDGLELEQRDTSSGMCSFTKTADAGRCVSNL